MSDSIATNHTHVQDKDFETLCGLSWQNQADGVVAVPQGLERHASCPMCQQLYLHQRLDDIFNMVRAVRLHQLGHGRGPSERPDIHVEFVDEAERLRRIRREEGSGGFDEDERVDPLDDAFDDDEEKEEHY